MNKKVNTLLFILCATLFNIFVAILSFLILFVLYIRFIMDLMPETERAWGFTFIFIVSMVISFVVYRVIFKYLVKKVDVEKYFDPIFVRKRLKKN